MRNMSFSLTTEAMRRREKTVTRRLGWDFLNPGDRVRAIEKGQGLKKGEKVKPLGVIEIISVRREPLQRMVDQQSYGQTEAKAEGFPGMTGFQFAALFCAHHGVTLSFEPNRIEFKHVEHKP